MATPKKSGLGPAAAGSPTTEQAPKRTRTRKPKQPAWYVAEYADGRPFRLIEDYGPEQVKDRLIGQVTIRPAVHTDFLNAGASKIEPESKPTTTE